MINSNVVDSQKLKPRDAGEREKRRSTAARVILWMVVKVKMAQRFIFAVIFSI
jgi:hypothetical protein